MILDFVTVASGDWQLALRKSDQRGEMLSPVYLDRMINFAINLIHLLSAYPEPEGFVAFYFLCKKGRVTVSYQFEESSSHPITSIHTW